MFTRARSLAFALSVGFALSGCASAMSSLESDGERVACNEIASKTGVSPDTVATGYTSAQTIYQSSNHTAAAKSLAAQKGAQKVQSMAGSKGVNLNGQQTSFIADGFQRMLH